jgi:hypothetical protein
MDAPGSVERFDEQSAGQTAAVEILNQVVDTCGTKLYEHYLKAREVPYSSRKVMKDIMEVVNWMYFAKDPGECMVDSNEEGGEATGALWSAEEEPIPPVIDSWATGALSVRRKQKMYKPLPVPESVKAPSEAGTALTRGSRRAASTRQSARSKVGGGRGKRKGMTLESRIRELAPRDDGGNNKSVQEKRKLPPEERARLRAIREMEKAEAAIQKRLEEEAEREREEKEKHEALMKELKGKDFVFDRNGNVIVINQMKPEKMPPHAYAMDVSVSGNEDIAPAPDMMESTMSAPPAGTKGSKKKKKKGGSSKQLNDDVFFKESTSQQPSLLQIMEVVGGVQLKEGDGSKQGPRRLEDPKKMSRATYKMHQTMVDQPTAGAENTAVQPSDADGENIQTSAGGQVNAPADLLAILQSGNEDFGDGPPSPIALASRLPETSMQDEEDENVKLIKANDWGANTKGKDPVPAPLPHKPNAQEKKETLGVRVLEGKRRAPRERPNITKGALKHLPPPLFPQTQGHGSVARLGGGGSQLIEASQVTIDQGMDQGSALSPVMSTKGGSYARDWGKDQPGSIHISPSAGHYVKQLTLQ